jgi:hypothetical protein
MGYEYIIRISDQDEMPSIDYLTNILQDIPGYFGQVQYPNEVALEFRTDNNQNPENMPDLYIIINKKDIVVCSHNAVILEKVFATLVLDLVTELKSEGIEVLKA